ncbi:MAG: prepilin-type N-terminal cleavage/methylation domain-containing protein [Oscillospiraceae bacterium]|nr:prepilin-type N-terminal cleavage/methylation domain-containing protein [Oscillospiraceae bacterium]
MRSISKKISGSKGFTLIEIMCVVAILGLISVSSYGIFVGATSGQKKSERHLDANAIAQAVMEDLLARASKDGDDVLTSLDGLNQQYSDKYGYDIKVNAEKASTALQAQYSNYTITSATDDPGSTDTPGATEVPSAPMPTPRDAGFTKVGPDFDDYNAQIEVFDYCDFDLYDMIKTGLILMYGNADSVTLKENLDFDKIFSIESFTEFDKYYNQMTSLQSASNPAGFYHFEDPKAKALLAKYGIDNKRYEWLQPCFNQLDYDDLAYLMKEIMGQYRDHISRCEMLNNVGSFGPSNGYNDTTLKNLIRQTLFSPPGHCYHTERGYSCNYNVFETIEYMYQNYLDVIEHSQWWKETTLSDSFKTTDIYNAIDHSWGANNFATAISNSRSYIHTHEFQGSGTKTGPWLVMKFYNKSKNIIGLNGNKKLIFIRPTEQGSNGQDIYFQLFARYLYFQKGDVSFHTEPGQNYFEIETIDIQQNKWTIQKDIFSYMGFFVTGGLTYRETTFGIDGSNGAAFLSYIGGDSYPDYYDPETGTDQCIVTWMTNEDGSDFYAKVDYKGNYLRGADGGYIPASSSDVDFNKVGVQNSVKGQTYKLRVMLDSPIGLGFYQNLSYDYIRTYNSTLDEDADSLLNLTDFSPEKPPWFGINMRPPTGNNHGGNTPVPSGNPGATGKPGSTGTPQQLYQVMDIPGQTDLNIQFKVDVYEPNKPGSNPLATLVAYTMGSSKFIFPTFAPTTAPDVTDEPEESTDPSSTSTPLPNADVIINYGSDTENPSVTMRDGSKISLTGDLGDLYFTIKDNDGNFELSNTSHIFKVDTTARDYGFLKDDSTISALKIIITGTPKSESKIIFDQLSYSPPTKYVFNDMTSSHNIRLEGNKNNCDVTMS